MTIWFGHKYLHTPLLHPHNPIFWSKHHQFRSLFNSLCIIDDNKIRSNISAYTVIISTRPHTENCFVNPIFWSKHLQFRSLFNSLCIIDDNKIRPNISAYTVSTSTSSVVKCLWSEESLLLIIWRTPKFINIYMCKQNN
jgi:hypothetical protein